MIWLTTSAYGSLSWERGYVQEWFAPDAAAELLHFRSILDDYEHADFLRVVLSRAARSARLTRHFDLDFPRAPQREPYWCHKHRRTCAPVQGAQHFVARYLLDALERIKAFQKVRDRRREAIVVQACFSAASSLPTAIAIRNTGCH
jgi:hypothetical protein